MSRIGGWIFSPVTKGDPRLVGLLENPIYYILSLQNRAIRIQRINLLSFFSILWLGAWTFYLNSLGLATHYAFTYTLSSLLVILLLLGAVYFQAGIEGYETNGHLRFYFRDIIVTGIPARDIATGVWGCTTRYHFSGIAPLLLASSLLLLHMNMKILHDGGVLYIGWINCLGIFCAAHLAAMIWSMPYVTLPGTLLWYRGVRKSYERRMYQLEHPDAVDPFAWLRFLWFIVISLSVPLIPLMLYMFVGLVLLDKFSMMTDFERKRTIVIEAYFIALFMGMSAGLLWGQWSERSAVEKFEELVHELEELFRLRSEVLFSRG